MSKYYYKMINMMLMCPIVFKLSFDSI